MATHSVDGTSPFVITASEFKELVKVWRHRMPAAYCKWHPSKLDRYQWVSERFRFPGLQVDGLFAGRSQNPASIIPLDGSGCIARTSDGVVSTGKPGKARFRAEVMGFAADERCIDLGIGNISSPNWELVYLPLPSHGLGRPAPAELTRLRSALHERVRALQFPQDLHGDARGCSAARNVYYVHEVPLVGFGSVIEYAMMFLARAVSLQKQLVLGAACPDGCRRAHILHVIHA